MNRIDLTGMIFGEMKVIEEDVERTRYEKERENNGEIKHSKVYWKCECGLCGKLASVTTDNLRSGNTKTCGCNRGDRLRELSCKRNEYHIEGDICTIVATNTGNCFITDASVYDVVSNYCWHETQYGYLATRDPVSGKIVFLHRLICLGYDRIFEDIQVDHINRNKRDARLSNLRECTNQENSRNKGLSARNTSGVVGVSYDKTSDKWRAFLGNEGKYVSLGYYKSYDDAVAARLAGQREYFGEFAPT